MIMETLVAFNMLCGQRCLDKGVVGQRCRSDLFLTTTILNTWPTMPCITHFSVQHRLNLFLKSIVTKRMTIMRSLPYLMYIGI
jgi:hypothetical protein